ncbi:hypothetical protein [Cohnella candidum]|uniref:Uncharacterized protein n=1 Tax=Cohnella candidum TaxID=2674991 RepID=A0A3G3JW98_9BACL|nr:hypothetical protein [Cohnella candidum]AYQ72496.1 hypothetical protein EAV92_07905 [Cohnella candidum]
MLNESDLETIKLLLNKFNPYIFPTKNKWNTTPSHNEIIKALESFPGTHRLALEIKRIFEDHKKNIDLQNSVELANKIWSFAYPYYPFKVAWHDGCQGWFVIWKDIVNNKFYVECTECCSQLDSPEYILSDKDFSIDSYGISLYPTLDEIKEIGWDKYIIKE